MADAIDAYDQEIAVLQDGKRETFASYREFLKGQGFPADQVTREVAALKTAIRRRRDVREDAMAVEEREEMVQQILDEISPSRAARDARSAGDQSSGSRQASKGLDRAEGGEADAGADTGLARPPTEPGETGDGEVIPAFLPRRAME